MMPYSPNRCNQNSCGSQHCPPGVPCPPGTCRPGSCMPSQYWDRNPCEPYRPPMNHIYHSDKYFYTILFLDDYFDQPLPPRKPGLSVYHNITQSFAEDSPLQWDSDDKNKLIIKHKLQLPITLEIWDKDNKPIIYAPVLKQSVKMISIGGCTVQNDNTIIVDFTGIQKPVFNELYMLGMKELPDFNIEPLCKHQSEAIQTLEEFMAVPKCFCKGLALVFRRNSLQGLFDLIADFDETYFKSEDQSADVKYLVKKSCYKDLHFTTKYTNNLQDVLDLVDVNYYKVEFSWQDHKKYKDCYDNYAEKYGYK